MKTSKELYWKVRRFMNIWGWIYLGVMALLAAKALFIINDLPGPDELKANPALGWGILMELGLLAVPAMGIFAANWMAMTLEGMVVGGIGRCATCKHKLDRHEKKDGSKLEHCKGRDGNDLKIFVKPCQCTHFIGLASETQ